MEGQPGEGGLHEAVSWVARNWDAFEGKTIQAVIPLKGKQGAAVLICSDGTFTVVPAMAPEPYESGEALSMPGAP